ncbi:C2H2 transcription factor (Swi5), putative [Penicillium digitatum PHI26]|uniref:C2H2 transcription factor (Swi5), putative n=2 Tax=Penicillium digitatum TaxID=36651 RepID=K9F9Y5_PEND2|nr:C2H2 transcription factor (Swi5), putative [Penicillium digitatum Pd1]EKV05949.1 C2H2 transcription factor (Swi5), putative [Penicillium digitatum PHI26]EKV17783.1 C2H2 transcription factor (Swi5), putative [Penicillium digitatum Pd1]
MNSNALANGRHRRQISTPVAPYQPALVMTNMQPHRSHRRGQTVDYSSFSQQPVDRHTPKTVSQLRDYFNEKSGFSYQQSDVQQYQSYAQQPERSFIPSGIHVQQPYQYQPQQSLGSDCQAFNQEQLQAIHTTTGSPAPSSVGAPALSRSTSESSENTPLKLALHRMQQEQFSTQQHQQCTGNPDWELFPQRNIPVIQNEQVTAYAGPMHPVSVQPKAPSVKILSQMSTACMHLPLQFNLAEADHMADNSPLTPDSTPLKRSIDYSMYSNDPTPSKSQSFSFPQNPVTAEMQRAQSFQGLPYVNSVQIKQQMPSPVNSPITAPFTEVPDMPSQISYGIKPQNSNVSATSSTGRIKKRAPSTVSSPIESAAYDDDLDARVKASVQQTGVSTDEIAKFISGPDPKDGKWVCLFTGCLCRFGRKENIKSHVQTHLGDRQFKCDICEKHFVRGHDLKRHLKTHSGNKPFVCACGASFARQDALTRHRQRDMCVGGFTGVVPKTTKRGRPPKKKNSRPDIDTRQAKSTRTRQRVAEKSTSIASAQPRPTLQDAPVFHSPNYGPSTAVSSFTPPTSPGHRCHPISSPCQTYNPLDAQLEDDMLPLSPPQLAHARYEQAMAQYGSNFGSQTYSQESLYSESALSPREMSSPPSAPTLAESSLGSEIDIFMTQDSSDDLREEFGHLAHSGLPGFSTYQFVDTTDFASVSSYYPEKTFSDLPHMDDDLTDPIDCLSNEFLVDP